MLTDEVAAEADVLMTMGCGEACPVVPGVARDDWPLEDPKGKPLERVRAIRSELELRVRTMVAEGGWLLTSALVASGETKAEK